MQLKHQKSTLALAVSLLVGSAAATAESPVETAADDSWITISGSVQAVTPDSFTLDYGKGTIVIEMDDWDADADGYKLVVGDSVSVTGVVDDDLFESRTIEASSVFVEGLNTYFYASAADEEDAYVSYVPISDPGVFSIQGTVEEVSGGEFVIDTGVQRIDVNVSELAYDPLDDEGFQRIAVGDRVAVTGYMDTSFFFDHDLMARSLVTLSPRSSRRSS